MKVLVVEDNPKLQKLLAHLLEKEGFDVVCANGGGEALASYAGRKPDILCLDVIMEDMSGLAVCKEVRGRDAAITIIMITSKSRDVDIAEGMAAGANDYIVKPFDLSETTAKMHAIACGRIARDNPRLAEESFELGDMKVFPGQLRAERTGRNIRLNFHDVGLLRLFREHKGAAVGPDLLKQHCWMAQSSSAEKAIQWSVAQLQKKIEDDPEHPALIRAAPDGAYIHG